MQIKLRFLGAAQNVTGSRYLLEANGTKLLVDCGLYQEREFQARNWDPFPVPPGSIDAVLLTHAHLDHCGLLPKLVREGFRGKIHCTAATAEIAGIVLRDAAHIQEEDAAYKRKRHQKEGRKGPYPEIPLYTAEDAEAVFPLFSTVDYEAPVHVQNGIEVTYHDAGHILGSSFLSVRVNQNGEKRTIVFSGDVGRKNKPILQDPTLLREADYIQVEATYGDRVHEDAENIDRMLQDAINETKKAHGNVVIPSFAVERSQELLYHLNGLLIENRIPNLLVFMDSPMAIRVTEVFKNHSDLFDDDIMQYILQRKSPFDFSGLKMTRSTAESKAINNIKGTVIIIAGSGMCTGGRIKHHLVNNITRPESTILFVGYQAHGTLGRQIVKGSEKVRIMGKTHQVRSRVMQIHGFSAHADRKELLEWLSGLKKPPRHVFVTHCEPEPGAYFAKLLEKEKGWKASLPGYRDEVVLD